MLKGNKATATLKPVRETRAHIMATNNTKQRYSVERDALNISPQQKEFKMKKFADVGTKIDNRR
jgi:hypothetical protein